MLDHGVMNATQTKLSVQTNLMVESEGVSQQPLYVVTPITVICLATSFRFISNLGGLQERGKTGREAISQQQLHIPT